MQETFSNILILGGGVAGMSAAQTFAKKDVIVHLVEKETALGGHAAMWACMATDKCQNCGACIAVEMVDQVLKQNNLTVHLNTTVQTIKKQDDGYEVLLKDKSCFTVKKIIMATGFSPFDPVNINSFHYDKYDNLITTVQLNSILKNEGLSKRFKDKSDKKIAFIQCVGSRNRELGRDYCSQVCCKISIRHAKKLSHLYPESEITIFNMDLQVIGKEIRHLVSTLSGKITLIQGIPAEILKTPETDMLSIVTQDKDTRDRISKSFDLIILSVGMQPESTLKTTCDMLNLQPNSWGFFNTDQIKISKDIIIAGCANGPKDIVSSRQDGMLAGAKAIEDLKLNQKKKLSVAVFGEGDQADQIAETISLNGYNSTLFGSGANLSKDVDVNVIKNSNIYSLKGTAGNFSINYTSENSKNTYTCAAIIAAFEPAQIAIKINNLKNDLININDFSKIVEEKIDKCPDNTAILLDYPTPEFKFFVQLAIETSIKAKSSGKNISIILNKVLVHGATGQRLYDSARQKGINFLRFETIEDLNIQDAGNGFLIKLKEQTMPLIELELNFDCLVVPPSLIPDKKFKNLSVLLHQPLDKEGFLQSLNIRHHLTQSLRKGVFFAGTCHNETDREDIDNEIREILSTLSTQPFDLPEVDIEIEINQNSCARCLTCIRICPHSAIVMNENNRPQIVTDSCFSCHLCVSNCPAFAIESKESTNDNIAKKVEKNNIVILACERSAALAADKLTLPDHITLVSLPCACRVSCDMILKVFLNGASKVIVTGCHEENCRSDKGSSVADASVKKVINIPGMDSTEIMWQPIAANETNKLQQIIAKVSEK